MVSVLMQVALQPMGDGTLGWLVFGCLITFLLSRRKGRTLLVSLGWACLSGGAAFFLGSAGTSAIERVTGAKIAKGAGEFFIAAFGATWIPPVQRLIAKKTEAIGE